MRLTLAQRRDLARSHLETCRRAYARTRSRRWFEKMRDAVTTCLRIKA